MFYWIQNSVGSKIREITWFLRTSGVFCADFGSGSLKIQIVSHLHSGGLGWYFDVETLFDL